MNRSTGLISDNTKSLRLLRPSLLALLIVGCVFGATYTHAAERDSKSEIIATDGTTNLTITRSGITQTFRIEKSHESPIMCDSQDMKITKITARIRIPANSNINNNPVCPRSSINLYAELYDDDGMRISRERLSLDPTQYDQTVEAFGDGRTVVKSDKQYSLRIYSDSSLLRWRVGPTNMPTGIPPWSSSPNGTATALRKLQICTVNPTILLVHDASDPYSRGSSSGGQNLDAVESINYDVIVEHNILVISFDPLIGGVTYTDLVGSVSISGPAKPIHEFMKFQQRKDGSPKSPKLIAEEARDSIERMSGGAIQINTNFVTISEFPYHISGSFVWPKRPSDREANCSGIPTPVPVINIPNFTHFISTTWPAYSDIPDGRRVGGPLDFCDGESWPKTPSFDYGWLLSHEIPDHDGKTLNELLVDKTYDEVWLFGDPTSGYGEGNNVGGAQPPLNINGDIATATSLPQSVPIMGLSFERDYRLSEHSFAHRAERVFASITKGNIKPYCVVNRTDTSFYNKFTRIVDCYNDSRPFGITTRTPRPTIPSSYFGSIGSVHKSHNEVDVNPKSFDDPERHSRQTPESSDADSWFDFPNIKTKVRAIGSDAWGGNLYYAYWLNHLPRYSGMFEPTSTPVPGVTPSATIPGGRSEPGPYNNIWPYLMEPGCSKMPTPRDSP